MKLFENKVGRPSNETLKKRKIFYLGVAASVLVVIIFGIFLFNQFDAVSLKGATSYLLGDVDMDGKLSNDDADLVLKYVAGNAKLTSTQLKVADMNEDGKITATDANMILKELRLNKGDAVRLNSTKVYLTSISKRAKTTKSGTYYIWGSSIKKGRIRIAKEKKYAGNIFRIYGWVEVDKIEKIMESDNITIKSISVDFSKPATILGRTSSHKVTFSVQGDTYKVESSNPKIVKVDSTSANSFTLRAVDSGSARITVTSNKTGDKVNYTYTVPKYELPDKNRFKNYEDDMVLKGTYKGIQVYVDQTCYYNSEYKKSVQPYIDEIKLLEEYTAKTIKEIYIISPGAMSAVYGSMAGELYGGKATPTNSNDLSGYGIIDLNCKQYDKYRVFHEAAHVVDFRYRSYYGKFASDDFNELITKYYPVNSSVTPEALRYNSYQNATEFFADAYARYYNKADWKFPTDVRNKIDNKIKEIKKIGW